jgi:DNA-binding transcriptional regulator YhcF (GntR family)
MARQLWLDFYLGRLDVGTRLPSVRSMARELGISPTTVHDYYQALEAQGIVEGRPRSGVFLRRLGSEADRRPQEVALFGLLGQVARRLPLLGISPARFAQLLLMRTGHAARRNFKFGFVSSRESFDLLYPQIRDRLGFAVPIVPLIAASPDAPSVAAALREDRTIRCLLTSYLHADRAIELARKFERSALVIRLTRSASEALSHPGTGKRYIVVRDQDFARGFWRLICSVCVRETGQAPCGIGAQALDDEGHAPVAACCERICIASLADHDALASMAGNATEVLATRTARDEVIRRYGDKLRVHTLSTEVADETVDDILFHYLLGDTTTSRFEADGAADPASAAITISSVTSEKSSKN